MSRWILPILLCLGLGIASTAAVTLACHRWALPTALAQGMIDEDTLEWSESPRAKWGDITIDGRWVDVDGAGISASVGLPPDSVVRASIKPVLEQWVWEQFDLGIKLTAELDAGWAVGVGGDWLGVHGMFYDPDPSRDIFSDPHYPPSGDPLPLSLHARWGWPLRSVEYSQFNAAWEPRTVLSTTVAYLTRRHVAHAREVISDNPVPLSDTQMIWSGTIGNTLFFSIAWAVLFVGLGSARGAIRRGRGRCPRCAYDLRGHKADGPHPRPLSQGKRGAMIGCPECGWRRTQEPHKADKLHEKNSV